MRPPLVLAFLVAILPFAIFSGCASLSDKEDTTPLVPAGEVDYGPWADRYNVNAAKLGRIWATAVIRLRYQDREGDMRSEQGEGRLQIVQPTGVALSISKLSQTIFWIGGDAERYWWLDLSGDENVAFVGRHEGYASSRARAYGVVVPPRDLIRLLGIAPLPDVGAAQVSDDRRRVGLTIALTGGGKQRIWLDPRTSLPTQVEIFSPSGEPELVAALSEYETVDVRGIGDLPRLATRIRISHPKSQSLIFLDLSSMEDGFGRMKPEAFSLAALLTQLRVDQLYDLDAAAPKATTP